MCSAQIFGFLPRGISYGLGIGLTQVVMQSLEPYDTTSSLGYMTTLAFVYIPSDKVRDLARAVDDPHSQLYSNPDGAVATIVGNINSDIPIKLNGALGESDDTSSPDSSASSTPENENDAGGGAFSGNNNDSGDGTSSGGGTKAGIAGGAVGAAAAYGAAMFLISRRYKKRKLTHQRTPSIPSAGEMAEANGGSPALMGAGAGAALMSGGRQSPGPMPVPVPVDRNSGGSAGSAGYSARTAQISAPMQAENSLGWN